MSYDGVWKDEENRLFRVKGDKVARRDGNVWVPVHPRVIWEIAGIGGDIYTRVGNDKRQS